MGRTMKLSSLLEMSYFGLTTLLFQRRDPLIGSLILTDRCNLACKHCAVNNITGILYPYAQIRADLQAMFASGVRILFFYGGEPFLWEEGGRTLKDLVAEAKEMGFFLVNVVTNGTFALDLPAADLIMVSLDGGKDCHNRIRSDTYDRILGNIASAPRANICLYMAINQINLGDIETVCATASSLPNVKAVAFNFHTPYPGTEDLSLARADKQTCCDRITRQMERGVPILNLRSAFPHIVDNRFKTPCYQCVVMENGRSWPCGRCVEIPGLCAECGFAFAAEFSLAFGGNWRVIFDMIKTYYRFL